MRATNEKVPWLQRFGVDKQPWLQEEENGTESTDLAESASEEEV
jgi:hypothetical protein